MHSSYLWDTQHALWEKSTGDHKMAFYFFFFFTLCAYFSSQKNEITSQGLSQSWVWGRFDFVTLSLESSVKTQVWLQSCVAVRVTYSTHTHTYTQALQTSARVTLSWQKSLEHREYSIVGRKKRNMTGQRKVGRQLRLKESERKKLMKEQIKWQGNKTKCDCSANIKSVDTTGQLIIMWRCK